MERVPTAEQTGPQQGDDVVEVGQFVLDGRRREEKRVIVGEVVDEVVAIGFLVFHVVSLVHDEDVPVASEHGRAVSVAFGGVNAGNDVVVGIESLELVIVVADEVESELLEEFALPLFGQLGRGEDQHRVVGLAIVHLLQDHANLNGLSEANLVSEECLPIHLEESSVSSVDLMFEEFDLLLVDAGE